MSMMIAADHPMTIRERRQQSKGMTLDCWRRSRIAGVTGHDVI
jgi:hypothetical protein